MQPLRPQAAIIVLLATIWPISPAAAQSSPAPVQDVLRAWHKLALALVRHTPTYTPPVASRAFAYLGVTAFEAVTSGAPRLVSLAGQVNGLQPTPEREAGARYDEAMVLDAAMALAVETLFENTGPTGQRAMAALDQKLRTGIAAQIPAEVADRSAAYGRALASHILAWSQQDGGAVINNMGFPAHYALQPGAAHWTPTSQIALQQAPLLPDWGKNRAFAAPDGAACGLPAPPSYSEDPASEFYQQAMEVRQTGQNLTPAQRDIARFWADDAMLSVTPAGHWISIALQILPRDDADLDKTVDVLVRLSMAMSDAFIACWNGKYQYDLLRPVTYIHRVIDAKWEPLLITPPFPEYPSGHSTQSAAAATVLTRQLGEDFAFVDETDRADGLAPRRFSSFWAAADEAAVSRLYGGIHFRAAIERGQDQGRCIGGYANALRTRR